MGDTRNGSKEGAMACSMCGLMDGANDRALYEAIMAQWRDQWIAQYMAQVMYPWTSMVEVMIGSQSSMDRPINGVTDGSVMVQWKWEPWRS